MFILSYAVKIAVSTCIIWLSIQIVDRGNYRNNMVNALITAVILSLAGGMPFLFFAGLIIWVYILINWYSIGFFKSFLCVFVYAVLFIILNIFLSVALLGGTFTMTKMVDTDMYYEKWIELKHRAKIMALRLPESVRKKLGIDIPHTEGMQVVSEIKKVRIVFTNGRSIQATILMEGRKGYLVDIADGRSEVVLRKDSIDHIEEL